MPWLITLLVVLVVAAGVVTTLVVRANRHQSANQPTTPSSQPAGSASPSASATSSGSISTSAAAPSGSPSSIVPPLLARGKEAPVSAIPWSQVNAGWNLRLWTPVTDSARLRSVPLILFLVNPVGGRYRIATVPPDSSIELWAPDRQHAMIGRHMRSEQPRSLAEWDLRSGRQLSSFDLGNRSLSGYADPAGQSIAVWATGRLARFSLSGQHLQDFPPAGSAVGEIRGWVLPSADGQLLVAEARYGLAVLRSSDAAIVGQVVRPAGDQQCQLRRWWTSRSVLADCDLSNGPAIRNLYSIPIDGRPATAITHAVAPDPGFLDGRPISGGTLLQRAGLCGPGGLAVLSGGTVRNLSYQWPSGIDGSGYLVGVFAHRASMYVSDCGSDRGSLLSLDLRTHVATVLLGPGLNGGSVMDVRTPVGP
jgi:TolB protein